MAADITAIILTKNEEINIRACIESISKFVTRVVVVDSYSTDKTVHIARTLGAEVIQHNFETHARQYKFGVQAANITTTWILRIDADERLTDLSGAELESICKNNISTDINGIVVRFKKNFLGKDLYHGGVYPWKKLICYKVGHGDIEDRAMDEHIFLFDGKTVELQHDSLHFDFKNMEAWIAKHNWYSSKEAADYEQSMLQFGTANNNQSFKTKLKMNFYYRLPLGVRAHIYYLYRYYIRLGFLDGKEGKIYAFMQAYWYRYLVDVKIFEIQKLRTHYRGDHELK